MTLLENQKKDIIGLTGRISGVPLASARYS